MNIYILTDGVYSDYHIIGIFTDLELAEKAKAVAGGDIETFEANEIGKDNRFQFGVYFRHQDDKDTIDCSYSSIDDEINKVYYYGNRPTTYQCYSVNVMAEDKEHAIKIASDLVRMYKATKEIGEV